MLHGYSNRKTNWILWGLLLFTFTLLNGCSTLHKKDGPPPFDVDVSKIPNAQPKCEHLAKYGNMPCYRVDGRCYYVMHTAKNYEERGVASWYGTKFHKQRTSSGERYDMLAMTAAHRTLPLPTYVEVTNLRNGRKVIVKVNDRGPFADNRIIDLSYVAAKKLGMVGHGTAYVDVKAIDPWDANLHRNLWAHNKTKTHVYAAAKKPAAPSSVYLQVGAFKNRLYAEHLKDRLATLVTSPIEITPQNQGGELYRVKIGPFKDMMSADTIQKKLSAAGIRSHHSKV